MDGFDLTCEVAVVGAGPAGSATAYFLAVQGFDVLLIDRAEFPRDKTCGDGLSPRALRVLDSMGLLAAATAQGQAIESIRFVSPNGSTVGASLPPYPEHPTYALVLPRMILDDLIRRRAVDAGARFAGDTHIVQLRRSQTDVELEAERGLRTIRARAAVLATGASTSLLQASGILHRQPPFRVAGRTYFEGLNHRAEEIDFHFDGVPLPGYGWVFPTGADTANVGAGMLGPSRAFRRLGANPHRLVTHFLRQRRTHADFGSGRQVTPVKSYPMRMDFAHAPTTADRVLLVGEACGLVNPLTGEGIDYALESGQMAAEFLGEMLRGAEPAPAAWPEYDLRLRRRFQRLFVFTERIRAFYLRPWLLDRLLRLAQRRPELRPLLVDVTMGMRDAAQATSPRALFKILSST